MADYTLTTAERTELKAAAILKYQRGEYGPISFQMRLRQIGGIDQDEIDFLKRTHFDECAKNMRTRNKI